MVLSDGVIDGLAIVLIGEVEVRLLVVGQELHQGGPALACSQHQRGTVCIRMGVIKQSALSQCMKTVHCLDCLSLARSVRATIAIRCT